MTAWTGGTRPKGLTEISSEERKLVRSLFREYCTEWLTFWGPGTKLPRGEAQTFWVWARYDAHATTRT